MPRHVTLRHVQHEVGGNRAVSPKADPFISAKPSLTAAGRRQLAVRKAVWGQMSAIVHAVLHEQG